jgi:hypothetical protein
MAALVASCGEAVEVKHTSPIDASSNFVALSLRDTLSATHWCVVYSCTNAMLCCDDVWILCIYIRTPKQFCIVISRISA